MKNSKLYYRPEVDGLRAIAILSVIIYHAQIVFYEKSLFKGGFIDGSPDLFFSVEDAIAKGTNYINPETKKITTLTGIGVHLNPITETAGFDFDGVGSPRNFEHHFGKSPKELPPTITTTSGSPGRCQLLLKGPKH